MDIFLIIGGLVLLIVVAALRSEYKRDKEQSLRDYERFCLNGEHRPVVQMTFEMFRSLYDVSPDKYRFGGDFFGHSAWNVCGGKLSSDKDAVYFRDGCRVFKIMFDQENWEQYIVWRKEKVAADKLKAEEKARREKEERQRIIKAYEERVNAEATEYLIRSAQEDISRRMALSQQEIKQAADIAAEVKQRLQMK